MYRVINIRLAPVYGIAFRSVEVARKSISKLSTKGRGQTVCLLKTLVNATKEL